MLNQNFLVPYLRKALKLQDPNVEKDEAYKFTDEELWEIVQIKATEHNSNYTTDNFPNNEVHFVILLAKKEVYFRLATSSAPFYPLEAEGASLRKDYRFEHYMSLIRAINNEYESAWERFEFNSEILQGEVFLLSKHFTNRNYENAHTPTVTATAVTIRNDSIDLSWDKFQVFSGMFYRYCIYVSESLIYDEFENSLDESKKVAEIRDIHQTKTRLKGLTPNTTYHILVTSEDMNLLKGYSEITVKTLS